ncbi:MAG: protein kinase family protein [Pseudonocardia sp.]|nr:protein kinase family protein [Pseudonocardia sp.]
MSRQSEQHPAAIPSASNTSSAGEPFLDTPSDKPSPDEPPLDRARPPNTAVGIMIAGRYRLLAQVGTDTSARAAFWQARDIVLQRDVGLTMLQRSGEPSESERAVEMISKALRWGRFEHPGCARLLDVMHQEVSRDDGGLPQDVLGLAVTEWVPGQSLAEALAAGPLRTVSVLTLLDPLAQGAEAAHRLGLVLGCAHPQRIRIAQDGGVRIAFALPPPECTPADDVRGLGATLYALLTRHWPLSGTDAELAGLPAAPRDVQDAVVPPWLLRPGLPLEVGALALGALGAGAPHGQVRTAAAVHTVLSDLLAAEKEVALLPPPDDGAQTEADEVWQVRPAPLPVSDRHRRRKLHIGLGGLGLAVLVVLAYVGVQVGSIFDVTPSQGPRIVVASPSNGPAQGTSLSPAEVVRPSAVEVFDPTGDPDNAGRAARTVDDNPRSSWSTYIYRQPFPALKPGVGLLVSFASPVQLSNLTISSPSEGSRIEIRSTTSPDNTLAQTVLITTVTVRNNETQVSLAGSQPVQHVLLWITKLGGGGDQNVTEISHLQFERATG